MLPPNILLMGLRASGKSTLGAMLATLLNRPFVDLDDVTAARLGCVDVPEAWARHGPAAFRDAEVEALRDVLANTGQIVALGGGTPTAPGAADVLRNAVASQRARLVYLRATPNTLRGRLEHTDLTRRPSLTGSGVVDEVQQVFDERDPLYRSLATETVEVDGLREDEVLGKLERPRA